jgi:peptide/nickel transport system permease protein
MIAYILRRVAQSVLVMLVVALVSFSLFRFVGDPVATMMGQEASQADREALRERLGLNDPVPCSSRPSSPARPPAISASPTACSSR